MPDQGLVAAGKRLPSGPGGLFRLFFADAIGITFLIWLFVAFAIRPLVLDAHAGGAGPIAEFLRGRLDSLALSRAAAAAQVAAFAGLMLVVVVVHARLQSAGLIASWRARLAAGLAYTAALNIGFIIFVWTPTTAVSLMLHDTFIFYDAIYRIDHGQHPSADFPTALGAASLYLPWLGSKISGGYAGSIEMASVIVSLALCMACAYACASRHGGAVTAALIVAIFLMVVPTMLEGYVLPDSRTFENGSLQSIEDEYGNAMFYNRWGWGALLAVFVFLTPRSREQGASLTETVVLGLLLVFLFWLKLSYFVVAAAAALLYAFLGQRPWNTLTIGAGVALGGVLLVALVTGNLVAYVADVFAVSRVSGARAGDLAPLLKDNLLYILLAAAPLVAMGVTGRLKPIDYGVAGLIVAGTLFVVNQNAQTSGLPTLLVTPAYALWRLRSEADRSMQLLAALAFALPAVTYMLDRSAGLIGQTSVARREEVRPAPSWEAIPAMHNVYVQERENLLPVLEAVANADDGVSAFHQISSFGRRQHLRSGEYLVALQAAMRDLAPVIAPDESVVVMDFSSPLAFLMEARPAKGYWITFDYGRTFSKEVHPEPSSLFADADHVMMPKLYVEPNTALSLKMLYSQWLEANYASRVETTYWTRWSRKNPAQRHPTRTSLIPLKNGPSGAVATQH